MEPTTLLDDFKIRPLISHAAVRRHQRRDAPEDDWFFTDWIDKHVALLVEARGDHDRPNAEVVAQVYMLASAICYYAASGPVLVRFYGEGEFAAIEDAYERELRALVRRMIAGG